MVGQTLGHYRIVGTLGSGGMGEVYAADDGILKRRVALKVLPPALAADRTRRDRFEREAQAVAALNHPGIVTIYSVELSGEVPFLTMELVEGRPLAESIGPGGVPLGTLLPIAISLADALATAHQRGVIHRDLKPANVMITHEGRAKVLDFGLAKLREPSRPPGPNSAMTRLDTEDGKILGTVAYMSPEQAEGKAVDARSDIFSLGVVLYEMAVGERPFGGDTPVSVLSAILRDTPPRITERNGGLPRDLDRIVRRCLSKNPRDRYQSAADLRNDLEDLKQETESAVHAPGGPRATPPHPRGRLVVTAALAAVALLGCGAGYMLWSDAAAGSAGKDEPAAPAADHARRIVVTVFENRTGDRSLDALGTAVSERLIQGLTEAQIGEPVSNPLTAADARAVRAGVVITGAFDQHGDTLTFQTKVMRGSDDKVLYAPPPVSVPKGRLAESLGSLHQNVKAFVDMHITGWDPAVLSRVPVLEAEREHVSGVELFGRDMPRAMRHFQRALEIDPQFVSPRLFAVVIYQTGGRWQQAVETLAPLVEARQRLSKYEQAWVDYLAAEQKGRYGEALAATLEAERLAPQDYLVNLSVGLTQLRLNRAAAALATFGKLNDPKWLTRVGISGVRVEAALVARHMLGDFERERQEAIDARRSEPRTTIARDAEARALVGLGKYAEALQVVDELLTIPGAAGPALINAARELRAHGSHRQSVELAMRAVQQYRSAPPELAAREATQAGLARALYAAEKWEDAQRVVEALNRMAPDKPEYVGLLGVIRARRGDRARAGHAADSLRRLTSPYLFGSHTMWRARIAALLDDRASAVELLRVAISQGTKFTIEMHRDMDLEPLKDNAAFRELMRPKD